MITMFFKQIKHRGDNFSYIIADESSGEAVVVDPSFNVDAIIPLIQNRGLTVKYIVNTHHHRDHSAGNKAIKSGTDAKFVAHKLAEVNQDVEVDDGDTLRVGGITIEVIHTPGHSTDSICLLVDEKLLTGDTLFVGECGRTDISGGSSKALYNSLFHKLMTLDDDTEVYPGHDYGSRPHSTIGEERRTNYTLKKRTLSEFIEFMKEP
jgi:glyoxylase-like metal-dependent hydrolase (beta-lactamase superfamily II)